MRIWKRNAKFWSWSNSISSPTSFWDSALHLDCNPLPTTFPKMQFIASVNHKTNSQLHSLSTSCLALMQLLKGLSTPLHLAFPSCLFLPNLYCCLSFLCLIHCVNPISTIRCPQHPCNQWMGSRVINSLKYFLLREPIPLPFYFLQGEIVDDLE